MNTPLLDALLALLAQWKPAFCQQRTLARAIRLALAQVLTPGVRMISRLITSCGREQRDWSADYKLFSRSRWRLAPLFAPALARCVEHSREEPFISVAGDLTHVRKTGKKVPGVHCMRDPMSPPFHVNLIYGLRFLQLSCLLPLYRANPEASPRSVPVLFEEVPVIKKPPKNASAQQVAAFRAAQRERRAMTQTLDALISLRQQLDECGCLKTILASFDGGFCNRTIFQTPLERVEIICRARKDAKLCHRTPPGSRRFFDARKFRPEEVRQDESIPWQEGSFFHGGGWRELRFKEVDSVYWQQGARRRALRLIVVAPTPYRLHRYGRCHYRQPAYLLTTDLETPAALLVQAYLDHWQIEVNHREEKSIFGIGDAQVRNEHSVPRQPAFAVAIYSLLLLAALEAYGVQRTSDYLALPKWRPGARRPSCADIIAQLRREMDGAGTKLLDFEPRSQHLTSATLMAAA
jgi:hypothetical protein